MIVERTTWCCTLVMKTAPRKSTTASALLASAAKTSPPASKTRWSWVSRELKGDIGNPLCESKFNLCKEGYNVVYAMLSFLFLLHYPRYTCNRFHILLGTNVLFTGLPV